MRPTENAIEALLQGIHADPFSVLGVHQGPDGIFIRAILPGAEEVEVYDLTGACLGSLTKVDDRFLFEGRLSSLTKSPSKLPSKVSSKSPLKGGSKKASKASAASEPLMQPIKLQAIRYRCMADGHEWTVTDPYSFGPVLGPIDDLLIAQGTHLRLYDKLGAHLIEHEGVAGTYFAVSAPNARLVSVVGDFNDWNPVRHVMRNRKDIGVWEIFLPDVGEHQAYKFHVVGSDGVVQPLKADPYAFRAELRPATASVIAKPAKPDWGDAEHRVHWASVDARRVPISIYEVHAGSWQRNADGWFLNWDQLAEELIPYVVEMGFTHIEFLPISEHPYDPSWGYQTTGLFAPSARFGEPAGFARFVDGAHRAGLGVLLDWVPAHFPKDAHGLVRFDGTALYEHDDPKLGHQPDWNTLIYYFGRREVQSFLVNNALFWADQYHVDGLRVDAVASMLYRDYSRKAGEWIPNDAGGRENWEAVDFLRKTNRALHAEYPGFITIAEESTTWPGVTQPAYEGDGRGRETALGFGFKWNMGFMNDTLRYMGRDPVYRRFHHSDLTFGLMYAFSENYVLPLSHDEVVHGKGSILGKMSGDAWQQFANLRAYYTLMWAYPGKKLLFMGQEFAQRREWSEDRALDWELRLAPAHEGVRNLVKDLNHLYRVKPALHASDCDASGFEWLVVDDSENSVFAWLRKTPGANPVAMVANMTPTMLESYRLPLPLDGKWVEILNSDAEDYGGSGRGNWGEVHVCDGHASVVLPPLATVMFEYAG